MIALHHARWNLARGAATFLAIVLAVLAVASLGCAPYLAGTADVELTYEVEERFDDAAFGQDLRALVMRRLTAASVGADVTQQGKALRIVVDERLTPIVDELVTWSGTALVCSVGSVYGAAPRDARGLAAKTEEMPDGMVVPYWEGNRVDVVRAIERWEIDRDHRVVAEPIWSSARGASEPRYRTRVVRAAPIAELGEGVFVGWGERGALRLRAQPDTPAAIAIERARAAASTPDGEHVIVRGRTSLGRPSYDESAVHLAFGTGIEAYARAQDEKQLLTTPRLPRMKRVGAVGLPVDRLLASACFVVPVLLSMGWLVLIRRFDRAHPEPTWLVAVTFVLGALSTVPAAFAEAFLGSVTPWLDPRIVTFGGQLFALPLAFVVLTIVVGLSEEGMKLASTLFAARRPELDEPVDGILYGIVASLGFAAAENIRYFAMARLAAPIVVARCFMSVPAHMFFGAIWGYAIGARLVNRKISVVWYLCLSAAAHGLFDALLSTNGGGLVAVALNVVLASVFVTLVRRALRHGIVDEAVAAIVPEHREMFRVGRPTLFFLSSFALHVLAFGIVMLGGYYQLARHRPTEVFVLGSSMMLALLAASAFGVSATMPLDVVVDDYGVTFAGAARAWTRIDGFEVEDDRVVLACDDGAIILGPGSRRTVAALAAVLRRRLG